VYSNLGHCNWHKETIGAEAADAPTTTSPATQSRDHP
jgi:hypothetical protein